jgi:hypothetical protein
MIFPGKRPLKKSSFAMIHNFFPELTLRYVTVCFQEKRGRHFLAPDRKKPRTPSKSPERDSSPETHEAQTIQKLKDIQELVVKDSEKFVAEPPNPDQFEWDEK